MELDLGLASSFLVLVDERHYGRAAARLHLTSSALTKRIQRLERQLGATLVERGPTGVVSVNAAGLRFAEACGPLLAHAATARAAVRPVDRFTLRIGVPAGTGYFLSGGSLPAIGQLLQRSHPEAHVVWRGVPFPALNDCLDDGDVDVLWTTAPVARAAVESVPLEMSSEMIGLVGPRHPLATAGSVRVDQFAGEPMLYNPGLTRAWMEPFWLSHVRPRREARLVSCAARDQGAVLRRVADASDDVVTTSLALTRPMLGSRLHPVTLEGAPRLGFHAVRRRADRRDAVLAVVEAFAQLPSGFLERDGGAVVKVSFLTGTTGGHAAAVR